MGPKLAATVRRTTIVAAFAALAARDGRCVHIMFNGLGQAEYSVCAYPGEACWDARVRWVTVVGEPCRGSSGGPPAPQPVP